MGDYMKDNLSGEKIGFTQGVVYAVAVCIRNLCEGGAELIWKESNFNFSDLSVCDDYDSTVVLEYFKRLAKEPVIKADAEKLSKKCTCERCTGLKSESYYAE